MFFNPRNVRAKIEKNIIELEKRRKVIVDCFLNFKSLHVSTNTEVLSAFVLSRN